MTGIILAIVFGVLVLLCSVLFSIIWAWSPGKVKPYYDNNDDILTASISEIVKVEIGGMEQGMIIKGKNIHF